MLAYFNGNFVPKQEIKISPDDRGFLFADGIYEVIRSYGGKLFRADEHMDRMIRSLKALDIKLSNIKELQYVAQRLITDNELSGDATVYIQVTRGEAPRKHVFPPEGTPPTVYACASAFHSPESDWKNGVRVILVPDIRWTRCDIKTVGLIPNVLANQEAKKNGAWEAIFVRDGALTEGTHTNFAAVLDGKLFTFPECNYILPGITRQVVLELCAVHNIQVKLFPVFEQDLKNIDEAFLIGTSTEVMPVVQIGDRIIKDGKPGPITLKLQKAFRQLITEGEWLKG